MDKRIAYMIDGKAFSSAKEAEDHAEVSCTAGRIGQIELREDQQVVEGRIMTLVDAQLAAKQMIEYKVIFNDRKIPFWENFEGAKACVQAINSNKQGNRARLMSFMNEKEIEV